MNTNAVKKNDTTENIKVVKTFMQNGFKVTVCERDRSDRDRRLADIQMKKQLLEYMALTV